MRRRLTVAAVVWAVALGGCSSSSSPADTPPRPKAPAPMPVVNVTMVDHTFQYDPKVPAGRVLFRISNAGQAPHRVVLFPLPEDLPPIDEQLRGSQRRFLEPFAGTYDRRPGDTGTFVVDLVPGTRYAMICPVKAEDGEPHWMKGMATEFRTPGVSPTTDTSVPSPAG